MIRVHLEKLGNPQVTNRIRARDGLRRGNTHARREPVPRMHRGQHDYRRPPATPEIYVVGLITQRQQEFLSPSWQVRLPGRDWRRQPVSHLRK
jgi:hypothetical protein